MAFRRAISHRPRNFFKIPPRPPRLSAPLGVLFPAGRRCAPESWVRSAIRPYPGFPFAWIFRHSRAPSDFRVLLCARDIFMRCLARSRSSRPSGCLRQATRPAPAGTCSALRVSLCTAEDCHGYNKFSPWLCASVRAPSNFLPFAGPKPQKNLTPAIEQIPPTTTVGGTPTLLEPPLRASARCLLTALRSGCPPWATHLSFPLDMRYRAGVRVIRGHLLPLRGCASRSLCRFAALELRSLPTPIFWNPLRGLHGGEGGIDSGLRPSPLRGCASRSLCRFAALELRSLPTPIF